MPACCTSVNDPCPLGIPNASCVVYTGPALPCMQVSTNERLDDILVKIDALLCDVPTSSTTVTGDNGLNVSQDGDNYNVELGGNIIKDTTLDLSGFFLTLLGVQNYETDTKVLTLGPTNALGYNEISDLVGDVFDALNGLHIDLSNPLIKTAKLGGSLIENTSIDFGVFDLSLLNVVQDETVAKILSLDSAGRVKWKAVVPGQDFLTEAVNGLHIADPNQVSLGGTLIEDTLIDQDGFDLNFDNGKVGFNTSTAPSRTITVGDDTTGSPSIFIYAPDTSAGVVRATTGAQLHLYGSGAIKMTPNIDGGVGGSIIVDDSGFSSQYVSHDYYSGGALMLGQAGLTLDQSGIYPANTRTFYFKAYDQGGGTVPTYMEWWSGNATKAAWLDSIANWHFGTTVDKGSTFKVQVQGNIYSTDSIYLQDSVAPGTQTFIRTRNDGNLRTEFRNSFTNDYADILPLKVISPAYASVQWFGFRGQLDTFNPDMFTVNMVGNSLYFGPGQRLYMPSLDYQGSPVPANTTFFDIFFGATKVFEVGDSGAIFSNSIPHASVDTDKHLVSDGGVIKYRTLTELALAVGAITTTRFGVSGEDTASSANRAFDAGGFNFAITNALTYTQSSTTYTLTATNLNLKVVGFGARAVGDVLRLVNTTTGEVGWTTPVGGGGTIIGSTGATDNALIRANGTGGITVQTSIVLLDDLGNISPATNDVGALGTTSLKWADLFLASGSVINFNSGDVTITHSANALTVAGGALIMSDLTASKFLTLDGSKNVVSSIYGESDIFLWGFTTPVTNYTLILSDGIKKVVEINSASSNILTIPANASVPFPIGTEIYLNQLGAGTTTIAGAVGVTVRSLSGVLTLSGQYAGGLLVKRGTNDWYLMWVGNTIPANNIIGNVGASDNRLVRADGTGGLTVQGSAVLLDDSGNLTPAVNDVGALGSSALKWADLWLANGAIINWNSSDITLTHSSNLLTLSGGSLTLATGVLNITGLTASRMLMTDGSKNLVSSAYTESDIFDITYNTRIASYTLALTDARRTMVEMNVAAANNLTVPTNATVAFPVGTQILISQYGAGQTTVVAALGVTIRSSDGLKLRVQYSGATLVKRGTNEWELFGDTTP